LLRSSQVYDDNIGSDALIGKTTFSLMNYMKPAKVDDADAETGIQGMSLMHKGKAAGELRAGVRFLPAGKLTVKCISGRELRNPDSFGKADPFVQLAADSQMQQLSQKFHTNTHSDGGSDPQWNFDCEIDIIDQYELKVECMDKDMLSSDLIGDAELSLLDLFKEAAATKNNSASLDVWLPLTYKKGKENKVRGSEERSEELTTQFLAPLACLSNISVPNFYPTPPCTHSKPLPARYRSLLGISTSFSTSSEPQGPPTLSIALP